MKNIKKVSIFILAVSFVVCLIVSLSFSTEHGSAYAKYYDYSLNDDNLETYDDESILVVLSKEATFNFKPYTSHDFSEYNCTDVTELTAGTLEIVKAQLNNNDSEALSNQVIDLDKYRRILKLKFSGDKSNLASVAERLETRRDISCANLNYVYENDLLNNYDDFSTYLDMRQWAINNIKLPEAWNITRGSKDVNVGIIDTGIDGTHQSLVNNLDNSLHRDFRNATTQIINSAFDTAYHGTHVAGIIGLPDNSLMLKVYVTT